MLLVLAHAYQVHTDSDHCTSSNKVNGLISPGVYKLFSATG